MSKTLTDFKAELLETPEVRLAYEAQAPEYAIARAIIEARTRCGLTQAQLAERMKTSQSYIARLESAQVIPTMKTFLRVAEATESKAHFSLEQQ
ncbi:helix-turn-helix domain-containing protein [Fodinicurvata fenggangensis]|uniref:helix-turn-helix domain-containing protein n=1 Tax=Fodinicurvata fenggangensis TaxID=1121830 RepID=UPI00047A3025|nr:helix-turn-helix transcriptional regulator [Fodinicurvata fenggangensis]